MKTYDVSLWVEEGYCVTVKAKTEEEAEDREQEENIEIS